MKIKAILHCKGFNITMKATLCYLNPVFNLNCLAMKVIQMSIDHFTVVCYVTWPLNGNEAGGDLVSIQTSLPLLCKSSCSNAN